MPYFVTYQIPYLLYNNIILYNKYKLTIIITLLNNIYYIMI